MSTLDKALEVAVDAHTGMTRNGLPFILHPLRVMFAVEGPKTKMVAILHDVVEDTDVTIEQLRLLGFSKTITAAIGLLTRKSSMSYRQYIARLQYSDGNTMEFVEALGIARMVKLADLNDNLNDGEIRESLRDRYLEALERLQP